MYVTPRGLTTSAIPSHGDTFDVSFDFIEHTLIIRTSEGTTKALPLIPRSVAAFYREFMYLSATAWAAGSPDSPGGGLLRSRAGTISPAL